MILRRLTCLFKGHKPGEFSEKGLSIPAVDVVKGNVLPENWLLRVCGRCGTVFFFARKEIVPLEVENSYGNVYGVSGTKTIRNLKYTDQNLHQLNQMPPYRLKGGK